MADSAWIPGMFSLLDRDGDPVCDCLIGDVPIVISVPHAGRTQFADGSSTNTSPPGAKRFGTRQEDPANPRIPGAWFSIGKFNTSSDTNLRHVAYGLIRSLLARGVHPYAVINRVLRNRMDLARPWELQHLWSNDGVPLTPAEVEAQDADFKRDYHSNFHATVASFVADVAGQGGWLFDIHGQGQVDRVTLSTTAGWAARSDWMYLDGAASLFGHFQQQQLAPVATAAGPEGVDGPIVDFIPGLLHGATDPFTLPRPTRARLDPVVPGPGRVHGVHVEVEGAQRVATSGTREQQIAEVEQLGARLGEGIYGFLEAHAFFAPARARIAARERAADEAWYATASGS